MASLKVCRAGKKKEGFCMKLTFFKSRIAPVVAGACLAATLGAVPGVAGADDVQPLSTDGYVTAAATRAAQPSPEILGLSGVEETANDWYDVDKLTDWSGPKYMLLGTSEFNTNPNPYFYNYMFKTTTGSKVVVNTARSGAMGPRAALGTYAAGSDTEKAVWDMMPDVVVGTLKDRTGTEADYSSSDYAGAVSTAHSGVTYNPTGVNYLMTNNSDMITTMYNIAKAGDAVVANDATKTKKLRYGSATDIAKSFERYIRGTQGYVLQQLANSGASKKVVASVSAYDASTKTFTLVESNVSEGTASTNRYLEACEQVSSNLATTLGKTTATAEELAQADLVVIGGQSGSSADDILKGMSDEQKAKCYYVTGSGSAGSMYGVVMNSVENAQNIGRILGCLYPEYVDQDDWISYYYDNFYHIKSEKLAEAVDNAMDGVRNWDNTEDPTAWTTSDTSTYSKDAVNSKIDAGMLYLQSLGTDKVTTPLQPTDNGKSATVDIAAGVTAKTVVVDDIADQPASTDGSAVKPEVTVTYNGNKLTEGVEYDVAYTNNTAAGTATVTITGKGAFTGSTTKTFKINAETALFTSLAGEEASQTSVAISKQAFPTAGSCKTVILARDDDFADAMASTGLAGKENASILLISRETGMNDEVKAEIQRLGATQAYIIGGKGAIPADVESQLTELKVELAGGARVFGEEAAETSVACAKAIGTYNYAVVAISDNFQDALSMSSFAYKYHVPIILEKTGATAADRKLPEGGLEKINAASTVFVAGGTGALSDDSIKGVTSNEVVRIAGYDGYDTSNQIAWRLSTEFKDADGNYLLNANSVTVANGAMKSKGVDALAGAALAGKQGGVLVLVQAHEGEEGTNNDGMEDVNTVTIGSKDAATGKVTTKDSEGSNSFVASNTATIKNVYTLGGNFVIPTTFINEDLKPLFTSSSSSATPSTDGGTATK